MVQQVYVLLLEHYCKLAMSCSAKAYTLWLLLMLSWLLLQRWALYIKLLLVDIGRHDFAQQSVVACMSLKSGGDHARNCTSYECYDSASVVCNY
jgi:hypothetical protein